jgi:hypothetical protein
MDKLLFCCLLISVDQRTKTLNKDAHKFWNVVFQIKVLINAPTNVNRIVVMKRITVDQIVPIPCSKKIIAKHVPN